MNINFEILPFDYLVLSFSIIFIIFGLWKGFINSILSLLSWVGAIFLTITTYDFLSTYFTNQIIKINLFSNLQPEIKFIITIISIPFIFLISLFILKRVRKFFSSDLDKQILGLLIDKFFGILYGIIFSYLIFSLILYFTNNIDFLKFIYEFMVLNSNILNEIDKLNIIIIESYIVSSDI